MFIDINLSEISGNAANCVNVKAPDNSPIVRSHVRDNELGYLGVI